MKKILKIVLPLVVIGSISGCCCPQPVKTEKQIVCTQVTTKKVTPVCNTCPKPLVTQKQTQNINVNVKIETQPKEKTSCTLSKDAPIAPYIDNY